MAGAWPDPPGRRVAYDRNGSGAVLWNTSVLTQLTNAQIRVLNNENADGVPYGNSTAGANYFVAVVFADPMTIHAAYWALGGGAFATQTRLEYSLNTTNGQDGTWTALTTASTNREDLNVPATYRLRGTPYIEEFAPIAGIKGMRIYHTTNANTIQLNAFHLYGDRTPTTGNFLRLWHPTLNQPLVDTPAYLDLGDVPSTAGYIVKPFRVRNCSGTLNAQNVIVTREALTDGTPPLLNNMDVRYNGGAYGASAIVGALAPGEISQTVDLRFNFDGTPQLGLWSPRVLASATSWA